MSFVWRTSKARGASIARRRAAATLLVACLALVAPFASAQQPTSPPPASKQPPATKQRDLRVEKDAPPVSIPGQPQSVRIPRSYALVVGIANYQNLAAAQQLQFPERDAESVYSILISTEGGNFRAENVHKLVGARATLAGLRYELEEWLPSVAKDDDRVLIYFAGHGFVY